MNILCAALLAAALGGAWPAWSAQVAGVVTSLDGKPQVRVKGAEEFKAIKRGDKVREGDWLKTGPGERLALVLVAGVEFRMNENSLFEVRSGGGGAQDASLWTKLGQAWTRRLSGIAGLRIKTPAAVAAVRGTEADVDAEDEQLSLKVYNGHVDLLNAAETKTLSSLTAGQMTDVGASGVAPVREMTAADYGKWQEGLEGKNPQRELDRLQKEAEKTKTLQFKDKDGRDIEIPIERK